MLAGNPSAAGWVTEEERQAKLQHGVVRLADRDDLINKYVLRWLGPFEISMQCTRNESHAVRLYFQFEVTTRFEKIEDGKPSQLIKTYHLTKCGQWPSLVDFQLHQIEGLSAAFSDDDVREWKRSLMTQAHGFYVAGCVHLRRMFESILIEARSSIDGGKHAGKEWPEFDVGTRMPDRVKLVASELPSFIVEHPELYGVLSKGVHQLTEEECARELPTLQQCMRLIAEQRIEKRRRSRTEAETKKLLSEAASRLGKKSSNLP